MKKRGVISGVILASLIISILLISVVYSASFVSADLFSDIWSKITGQVSEENISAELKPIEPVKETPDEPIEETSCSPIPLSMWCSNEKTLCPQAKDEKGCLNWNCDACELKQQPEPKVPESVPEPKEDKIICCAITPILEERVPTKYEWRPESECDSRLVKINYAKVSEEYCEEKEEPVPEQIPKETKKEPVPEPKVEVCATKIKITSDKEIYYYGDYPKITVDIFDSQGTHIPNYNFYSKIYNYADELWHTGGLAKTDQDGYFTAPKGRIEEGKQAAGKTKLKVFTLNTGKYADCNSIEDIIEFEIKKGEEKEEVCGIGVCVPEEELLKEPTKIPKEKEILYSCTGCKLEDKCYPFGYRKAGGYCSEDYEFISQKEEGGCENNFECKSNVCVSGECVSEGLIKRIILWFKKLFGREPEPEMPEEPRLERCSELLIEKDIGDYEYNQSAYGNVPNAQAPLYSEKGERIGVVKCCVAQYINKGENEIAAMACPYDSREELYNSLKWLSARGELVLEEYKGQKIYNVYGAGNVKVWTHKEFILAVGADPKTMIPFSEEIANAYLEKYPNDLEVIEAPEKPALPITGEDFRSKIKELGSVTLIDFETLPDGAILQNGDRLTGKEWESLGVVFETPSEEYLKVFGAKYPFNPIDKLSLSPGFGPFESGSDTDDDLNIIFNEPVKAAGIYLLDLGETDERESITFLDKGGNIIKKISPWPKSTFGNPAPGTFVYLIEDGISKIEILENTQDGDDIGYDNLYFVK